MSEEVTTQEQLSVPYNPNLLVTYKAIPGGYATPEFVTYMTEKVVDIEWGLHNGREALKDQAAYRMDKSWLEDQITEWYNPNYDKEDVLSALAEHFKINPTKEIDVYGTVTFSGTITVPVSELEDFNVDNVNVDAEISSWDYDADFTVDEVTLEEN
jgi:hypothetical protein